MQYLVCGKIDEEYYNSIMTDYEIINRIAMWDCYDEEMEIYDIQFGKNPEKLVIYGTWHDFDNPLYIKVTDKAGKIMFDGYGTNH